MKLTSRQLKKIIAEEVQKAMDEVGEPDWDVSNYQTTAKRDLQGSSYSGKQMDAGILRLLRQGAMTPEELEEIIEDFGDDGTYQATLDHYRTSMGLE